MEKSSVIARLRELHAEGKPLNIHAAKRRYPELVDTVFSVRPYWGWRRALMDAGIDYGDIAIELLESVRCRVCGFQGKQLSMHLMAKHGLTPSKYRDRFPGAEIKSERQNAMRREAKNHLLPHWEPLYSEEYMMDRIAAYRSMGKPIKMSWIREYDHNLLQHVHRMGLEWNAFVARMGDEFARAAMPDRVSTLPPRDDLLDAIRSRATKGHAPAFVQLKRERPEFKRYIIRAFGSYSAAVKEAGLKMGPPKRAKKAARRMGRGCLRPVVRAGRSMERKGRGYPRMSRDDTISGFRERAGIGRGIARSDIYRDDPVLYYSILRHFRSFTDARREMGIDSPKRPGKAARKYPDKDAVTAELRRRSAAGLPIGFRAARRGSDRDLALCRRAVGLFGSWVKAVEAAGLEPPVRWKLDSIYTSRDAVLQAIRDRFTAGKPITRTALFDGPDKDRVLLNDALRVFRNWSAALEASGVSHAARSPAVYTTREAVIEAIRARARSGKSLRAGDLKRKNSPDADRSLHRDALRQFGSWAKVLDAAGLKRSPARKAKPRRATSRPKFQPPTNEEIFACFRDRLDRGLNLASSRMSLYPDSNRIYIAAVKRFGTWHNALRAAGYEPKEVTRPLRKPRPG